MIEKVSFRNFKSLRKAEVELGRFMVIVGPNGSGKTSILDGIDYLARVSRSPEEVREIHFTGPLGIMSRSTKGPTALELSGRFQGVQAGVEVVVTREVPRSDTGFVPDWQATVTHRWDEKEQVTTIVDRMGDAPPMIEKLQQRAERLDFPLELGAVRKLRLDVDKLAAASYSDEEVPRMAADGEGLGPVVSDLAGRSPETLQSILEATRKVIPTLERIRTRRAMVTRRPSFVLLAEGSTESAYLPVWAKALHNKQKSAEPAQADWGQQVVLDFKGAPDISAPLASEGTLLVIGLLTALYTDPRPHVLLLDDIDKALHPRAQEELIKQLRKVLELDPELQIIATSHSPYLLDHLQPEEVIVTALRSDGSTACAPLTQHPDLARWKSTTRTGEFWSFVGEDWVLERANAEDRNP